MGIAYRARVSNTTPDWEPLPVQYADYAVWQREFLGRSEDPDSVLSRQLGYWRDELAELPEQLALPFDRPRPEVSSYRGDAVEFEISSDVRQKLERVAADAGATLSVVLQSALATMLYRLGAGEDIPIGSPIAGRLDESLADLVGFFVNTWVLRARIDPEMSFLDLVGQVREKALAAYENQDVPFERVVEELNPSRSSSHHPLFQVSLAYQNNETPTLDIPG
ncbi:condensation domain-containing protein, partial [Rhodococcus sp. HNM0563]|uniref:condensation domain-containing protein n=1 Tax=Rhodococcus sp. HNM0563 TaxID=2716339 RepID=UPI0032169790